MKGFTSFAIAAALLAAGSTARAQDGKPNDPALEQRIQQLIEKKKQAQEQAQKDAAKQGTETPEQSVARAKLLADSEHDYEKALALVAKVGRDEKNAPELRAQALVVAARCLTQLGKADEARLQLQAAAQLNGPAADEAKRLLEGGAADPQLELRIVQAVEDLFVDAKPEELSPAKLQYNTTARDIIWVGAPAVPRIAKILADVPDLAWVTGAAYLLGCIGNADAAAAIHDALQRQDPLYRRAVLRGFEPMWKGIPPGELRKMHREFWDGPVREAATSLLKDRDAHVRESLLDDQWALMTVGEILAVTRDPEDDVRIGAWRALLRRLQCEGDVMASAPTDEIVAALRHCLKEGHDPVRVAAAELLARYEVNHDADGRELAFESMLDPVLTGSEFKVMPGWMSAYRGSDVRPGIPDRPLPIDLLVRVAERFGKRSDVQITQAQNALWYWIQWTSGRHGESPDHLGWDASQRSKVWQLLRWGYGPALQSWISANATAEEVPTIVDLLIEGGTPSVAAIIVSERMTKLSEEQRRAVARSLVQVIEADRVGLNPTDKNRIMRIGDWCHALLSVGVDTGDEELIRLAPDWAINHEDWITTRLLSRATPAVDLRLLPDLATLPAQSSNDAMINRNDALGRLAEAHSPELPKIVAKCYGRGLNARTINVRSHKLQRPRGFAWLVTSDFGPDERVAAEREEERQSAATSRRAAKLDTAASWKPNYSEAEVREAFEACAALQDQNFWIDVKTVVDLLPDSGPYDPIATAVLELGTRLVATAPFAKNDREPPEVVESLLVRRAPGWEELAMTGILDTRWRDAILKSLPEVTPGLLDRLSAVHDYSGASMRASLVSRLSGAKNPTVRARAPEFLKDDDPGVRACAISATLAIVPEQALDLVLPLAKDPSDFVRIELCRRLGTVFDRRVIPVLVDLLKDPSENVRTQAKTSLDALQYTFEQEQKWKRVLEGGGLESANAAEALVKQAAAGQPKATRLVAIESLGTLGVAETLPVLIQFMGDGDTEIAAAAKDAVTRINRQSKASKDAKPPADH